MIYLYKWLIAKPNELEKPLQHCQYIYYNSNYQLCMLSAPASSTTQFVPRLVSIPYQEDNTATTVYGK